MLILGLWYLTPHSPIFQLYCSGQFYWWRKLEYPEKTTDLPQIRQTLSLNVVSVHLAWVGFELTTLVVRGTDYISSCNSNYHTITTTTAPWWQSVLGQAHKCGRVKLINGIPTLSPLDNWIFNGNTNDKKTCTDSVSTQKDHIISHK
jgi:hypothetical protein